MMRTTWKWAWACRIGTSHLAQRHGSSYETPSVSGALAALHKPHKQDQSLIFELQTEAGENALCAIVCDGAGSATYGGQGAAITARSIARSVKNFLKTYPDTLFTQAEAHAWVLQARERLTQVALNVGSEARQFSCTLVVLIQTPTQTVTLHIGDGAIVARNFEGEWVMLSHPSNGEYASTTYFVTDAPPSQVRFSSVEPSFNAFAVFSDGIESIALSEAQGQRIPHAPFFQKMLQPLDQAESRGKQKELSQALGGFLDSKRVCDRTDDDKSLILVSRHEG